MKYQVGDIVKFGVRSKDEVITESYGVVLGMDSWGNFYKVVSYCNDTSKQETLICYEVGQGTTDYYNYLDDVKITIDILESLGFKLDSMYSTNDKVLHYKTYDFKITDKLHIQYTFYYEGYKTGVIEFKLLNWDDVTEMFVKPCIISENMVTISKLQRFLDGVEHDIEPTFRKLTDYFGSYNSITNKK